MQKGIIKNYFLFVFLISCSSLFGQKKDVDILRGLTWNNSKKESLYTLKSNYGLLPDQERTDLRLTEYRDQGEWLVFIADIDSWRVDLILQFKNDRLIQILYYYKSTSFEKIHKLYDTFYIGIYEKYGLPNCLDCDKSQYSYSELNEFVNKNSGCGRHNWKVDRIKTNIDLSVCSLWAYEENENELVVEYKPFDTVTNKNNKF